MKKIRTLELCPLCGGARKPVAKKSPLVIGAQARAKKADAELIERVEGESGDDQTADNFAEMIADLHRTL